MQEHKNSISTINLEFWDETKKLQSSQKRTEKENSSQLSSPLPLLQANKVKEEERNKKATLTLLNNGGEITFLRDGICPKLSISEKEWQLFYRNQKYDMVWWFTVQISLVACHLGIGQMEILDWTEVGEWGWESKIWKSSLFLSHKHDIQICGWKHLKVSWDLESILWLKAHEPPGVLCLQLWPNNSAIKFKQFVSSETKLRNKIALDFLLHCFT